MGPKGSNGSKGLCIEKKKCGHCVYEVNIEISHNYQISLNFHYLAKELILLELGKITVVKHYIMAIKIG